MSIEQREKKKIDELMYRYGIGIKGRRAQQNLTLDVLREDRGTSTNPFVDKSEAVVHQQRQERLADRIDNITTLIYKDHQTFSQARDSKIKLRDEYYNNLMMEYQEKLDREADRKSKDFFRKKRNMNSFNQKLIQQKSQEKLAKEEQNREQDVRVVANAIAQAEKKRKQLKDRDEETLAQYKHSLREQVD